MSGNNALRAFSKQWRAHLFALITPLALIVLYWISYQNYSLFHSIAEIFRIAIAGGIFMLTWNSRRFLEHDFLVFLGIAYLFIAGLDTLHMLGYENMGIFEKRDANFPAQLWVAARYMEAISLLLALVFLHRKLKSGWAFILYALVASLLVWSIFEGYFPDCFVEEGGLTTFKKASEYLISLILLLVIAGLFQNRKAFDEGVFRLLIVGLLLAIIAEIMFTLYVKANGFPNLVGHIFKIMSTFLLYEAIIKSGLENPYQLLFKELKENENALKESEKRFRLLYENIPLGYQSLDEQGYLIEANHVWLNLLGYTNEEAIGKWFGDFLIPEYRSHFKTNFPQFKAKGEIYGVEFKMQHKDHATIFDVMIDGKIGYDAQGNIKQTYCVVSNITERKRMEDALRASEEKFRTVVENAQPIIFMLDREGMFTLSEGVELSTLGLKSGQVVGLSVFDVYKDYPSITEAIKETWQGKVVRHPALQLQGAGGKSVYFDVFYSPYKDSDDKIIGTIGMAVNITERMELEEQIRNAEVLKVALEKEREITGLKDRFVSTISHEFRTPLATIQTASDLLDRHFDKLAEERRRQVIDQISKQIKHMSNLIDDTLSISRTDAGKTQFSPTRIDLEAFCKSIFEQIQFADNSSHTLKFISNPPDKPVLIDGKLLQHILTNLIMNAINYSPEQTAITVELNHDNEMVIIRVSDEGIGIPEADIARLFEPFHRAQNVGKIKGTGLGLAIVKQYVELHGGYIEIKSELGKGSTFQVLLPFN